MKKPKHTPYCCKEEAVWVDNVPGKEYFFCRSCRNEVLPTFDLYEVAPWSNWPEVDWESILKGVP